MNLVPGPPEPGPPEPGDRAADQAAGRGSPGGRNPDGATDPFADDEGPFYAWLPPEDRLWRHPSERLAGPATRPRTAPSDPLPAGRLAGRGLLVAASVGGLVGALVATAVVAAAGLGGRGATVVESVMPSSPTVSLAADAGGTRLDWTAADDAVSPAVVSISVAGSTGSRQASGVVFDNVSGARAYIVTDRSVFAPGDAAGDIGAIEVTFLSGATVRGRLVGQDRLSDLAVIEVDGVAGTMVALTGTVADLSDAQAVLAVTARTAPSPAAGSVSGENRTVTLSDGSAMDDLIAVTMPAMGPAAAGGPLVDETGKVVGITVQLDAADPDDQGLTYAVPVDEAVRVASLLVDHRPVTHPWVGIANAADIPPATAHQLGLTGGVQASQVAPGSPASRAGIRPGDIVTAFDGHTIMSAGELTAAVQSCQPGHSVKVDYMHDGRPRHTSIVIGTEPDSGG